MARLMTEEVRNNEIQDTENATVALFTKMKVTEKQKDRVDSKKQFEDKQGGRRPKTQGCFSCGRSGHKQKDCRGCFSCGEKGHISRNCPKKKEDNERQPESQSHAYMVHADPYYSDDGPWLVDSGASDHMTNRNDWFFEFHPFEEPHQVRV